jgi:hypothetical protein
VLARTTPGVSPWKVLSISELQGGCRDRVLFRGRSFGVSGDGAYALTNADTYYGAAADIYSHVSPINAAGFFLATRGHNLARGDVVELVGPGLSGPIVRQGDLVPGGQGLRFGNFFDVTLNDNVTAAFTASLRWPDGVAAGAGLFVFDLANGVSTAALTSDTIDVAPGATRQFASFGKLSLNNSGKLVFESRLTDGSWGIFEATVPEPVAALWCVGAVLVLAGRRSSRARLRSRV